MHQRRPMHQRRIVRIGPLLRSEDELAAIAAHIGAEPTDRAEQVCCAPRDARQLLELVDGADVVVSDPVPRPVLDTALGELRRRGIEVWRMHRDGTTVHRNGRLYHVAGEATYRQAV